MNRFKLKALNSLLITLIGMLIRRLSPELLRSVVDKFLDVIEDVIDKSENQIDDVLIGDVIDMIRKTFDVPDNDDTEPSPEV